MIYSQTPIARSRGDHFYKFELPEVRIKNSPHNNNMSSNSQRNETSSQPVYSSDQIFELSVLELSRFYCISKNIIFQTDADNVSKEAISYSGIHCTMGR